MISIERGLEIVKAAASQHGRPDWMPMEPVDLQDSLYRILRQPVLADADSPPFDKAIRDGFAVRSEDVQIVPVSLRIVAESRAGKGWSGSLAAGECCEIMTGAPLPAGATAVVMVEHSERLAPDSVRILKRANPNVGLLRQGMEARTRDSLLASGRKIGLADIALLASVGKASVMVSRRPRIAIIATGDELVEVLSSPEAGQIRNSNSYTLFTQCKLAGADPHLLGIAHDNLADLREKIRRGLEYDVLLVSGGVSMGKYDLVEDVFAEFGVHVFFDKVAMKPGKPTVFGFRERTFVFGLPGNPISTMVAFQMFVRPIILALLQAADTAPTILSATLEVATKCDPDREALVPALVRFEGGTYRIATAPWKGSSDLPGLARANALIMIPQREGNLEAGESARFLQMD